MRSRKVIIGTKNTYDDWGLILTKADIEYPEVKTDYVDIPKGDGSIDLTEALTGRVNYKNRKGKLEFDLIAPPEERQRILTEMATYLHGRVHEVILPDEPDYAYTARISINDLKTSYLVNKVVLELVANPYRMKPTDTVTEIKLYENLIEEGWDSFRVYGDGENHVKNWNFTETSNWYTNDQRITKEIKNNTLTISNGLGSYSNVHQRLTVEPGSYVFRVKKDEEKSTVKGVMRVISDIEDVFVNIEDEVGEVTFDTEGKASIYFYPQNILGKPIPEGTLVLNWVQVTPVDKQNVIYDRKKTNRLTHVQVWGGNNIVKIFTPIDNIQEVTTDSVYIENLTDNPMSVVKNNPYTREYISGNKHVSLVGKGEAGRNNNMQILAHDASGYLDFMATDPIIVQGKKAPEWLPRYSEIGNKDDPKGLGVHEVYIRKPTVPTIITDKEVVVKHEGSGIEVRLNKGEHLVPDLELQMGDNTLLFRSDPEANIQIRYREGSL